MFTPRDTDELWLAHAAPRRWFNDEGFRVMDAPTRFGITVAFDVNSSHVNSIFSQSQVNSTSHSPSVASWETTASVTLARPVAKRSQMTSFPMARVRVRCSPDAVAAGAVLKHATVTGATMTSFNATSETVSVQIRSDSGTSASFHIVALCSSSP